MSDENDVATASQIEGPTAAQILEQINEKKRELKAQEAAKPLVAPEPAPSPDPASPAPTPEPTTANKPAEPAPESGAGGVPGPEGKDKPDWKVWGEKKGLLRPDGTFDVDKSVRSQRELERELTRLRMGNGANAPPQANPPALPPMPQPAYPPPAYPQQRPAQMSEEEIAKRYGLDPDDLRRVGPLVADIAANISAQQIGPLMAKLNQVNKEVARNAELQSLKDDPAYHDPRVHHEMNRIMEENPSILQNEPAPWRYAFNEALRTIGRRILEGSAEPAPTSKTNSGSAPFPTTPPRTAGGSGPGGAAPGAGVTSSGQVTAEKFASLPSAEQRKILAALGRLKPEI